jgi:hypothetical protein
VFSLIRAAGFRTVLQQEMVPLVASLAISELLFKFHSFILEYGAFLVTWYALGAAFSFGRARWTAGVVRKSD